MVFKSLLTSVCVLLAFGYTDAFGAASIRATTVGASSGSSAARAGSLRTTGSKAASLSGTSSVSSTESGARMPVLPTNTPALAGKPKLPTMSGGAGVSLDGYATEAWTIENFQPVGDYQPAGDYLTESDLNGYATEDYVDDAIAGLAPHILIQASGDTIYYCIAAGCEDQPVGTPGYWAEFPTDGLTGADGREVELRNNGTYIQWRYKTGSDTAWKNLVKLSDLQGPQGNSPTVVVTEGESGTYTMTVTNADGTTQTVSWTGGGAELPDLSDYVKKSGYTSSDNNKVWQVKKSGSNYVLQLVSLSDVGGGISLDDVATAGYLNDLSGSTYVDADTNGNTGTIALKNITSSRTDITSTSTKLTRAMDVQSYVVDYVTTHGGGGSTTIVYQGLVNSESDLPQSGLSNGATYYVVDQQMFYIWNGNINEWDHVPFAQNLVTQSDLDAVNTALAGKQPKATKDYQVSKSDGTWQDLATSVTSTGENGVKSKGIYTWGTNTFQPKGNYLTEHQSLAGYATTSYVNTELGDYVRKVGPYTEANNGQVWRVYHNTSNGLDRYELRLENLPTGGGMDEDALSTYLTTNNYVDNTYLTENNYLTSANVDSELSATSENPVQNKVVKTALDGKQPKSNAAANTYKVGYTGNTWATLGTSGYVTMNTSSATSPKIALDASKIASSIGDDTESTNLATVGAVRGAVTAALVGQTPEDLQGMIQQVVNGQFQAKSTTNFQLGMESGGWKPVTSSNYIEMNNTADNAIVLTIPESALVRKNATSNSNPEDDDLVTLGGMRCVTTKTQYTEPSGTCQGTPPNSLSGFTCYTKRGETELSLQNTCLNTGWGSWQSPVSDSCGTMQYGNGYNYQQCKGYQEQNLETGTTYSAFDYILETVGCSTVYNYVKPTDSINMSTAQSDEGDAMWTKLKQIDKFNAAVSGGTSGYSKIYKTIGYGRTGQHCGGSTEWGSYSDDAPCERIAESDNYTYDICSVGTNPGTDTGQNNVDGKITYMFRKKKGQCQDVTTTYNGPKRDGAACTNSTVGNPCTTRGFVKTTITNSCDESVGDKNSYSADSCEFYQANGSANDILVCTQSDDNTTTYYVKVKGNNACGLMLVDEAYTAPGGATNQSYNDKPLYTVKGNAVFTYLNPCTSETTTRNSVDSDCSLADMGDMETNDTQTTNNAIYSCKCGGAASETTNSCYGHTSSNPKSYYWQAALAYKIKQCTTTTTEYVAPGIPQEGNNNLSNNCGTGSYPDCTVRGYSKITTKHNCSSDADTVDYAIDTCVVAKTQYSKDNRAASPWYDTTSATMTTRYLCTKNNGNKDTYFLESSGSGMCGKILVDIGYKEPGSCTNAGVCGTKGKKVKTYLDPCATGVEPGYAQVEHEEDEDICTLSAMEEVAYEEVTRSGNVVVPRSRFRSECTCGGAGTNGNVCYGHTSGDPKTYYWDNTVNVCAYKMEYDTNSKLYALKQNCDGTQTDVGGVCAPTVEYVGPGSADYTGTQITNDTYANVCNGSGTKCYNLPGKTITTPYHDNNGSCVADTPTSVEDTCEVNAELSYSKSNTNNYTYYDCTNGELSYTLRKGDGTTTAPYFKGLKQDVASKVNASDIYGNGGTSSQPASGSIAANAELARTAIQPGTGFNTAANTWLGSNAVISFRNENNMDQKATEVNLADFIVAMSQLATNVSGFCDNCTTEGQVCYAICHVPAQPVVEDQH